MQDRQYFVYMMCNQNAKVLYIGVTNDLVRRVYEHRNRQVPGFTHRYNVDRLVYFEATPDIQSAIAREKQIKGWRRGKKDELVSTLNPDWEDLGRSLGLV